MANKYELGIMWQVKSAQRTNWRTLARTKVQNYMLACRQLQAFMIFMIFRPSNENKNIKLCFLAALLCFHPSVLCRSSTTVVKTKNESLPGKNIFPLLLSINKHCFIFLEWNPRSKAQAVYCLRWMMGRKSLESISSKHFDCQIESWKGRFELKTFEMGF